MTHPFCDIASAKKFLCCGQTRLYQLINQGKILRFKDGSKSLIGVESLERYAASLMAEAA